MAVVVGSGAMPEAFEQQLIGLQVGDKKTIEFRFPDDYKEKDLAGHDACSEVTVHAIQVAQVPEVDEAFALSLGINEGGIQALREKVEKNLQQELDLAIKNSVKKQIMDGLLAQNTIDVPHALIKEEIDRIQQQLAQQVGKTVKELALEDRLFEDEASRRVRLGLLLVKIAEDQAIKANAETVRSMIERIADGYQERQAVIDYYYSNRELLRGIEALAIEEGVIDWLLGQVQVSEKPQSFKAVMEARHQ